MASEEYLREEIEKFNTLFDALNFIDEKTQINRNDLEICKGQKVFNPRFE